MISVAVEIFHTYAKLQAYAHSTFFPTFFYDYWQRAEKIQIYRLNADHTHNFHKYTHTLIHTPLLPFIRTAIHAIFHHGPSMGSNRSLIALSISTTLFFSLCIQRLCVTSDRENVLENYCLLDGSRWQLQSPWTSGAKAVAPLTITLLCDTSSSSLFFPPRHPLIITKPYLLFEGGPMIKAAAAPDATPASTSHSHSDRSWHSISYRESKGF